jgi:hypothetical protein
MSITVPADIFKWLQAANLVKEGKKAQDNKIEISPDASESLKVGYLFAEVLKAACKNEPNCNCPFPLRLGHNPQPE